MIWSGVNERTPRIGPPHDAQRTPKSVHGVPSIGMSRPMMSGSGDTGGALAADVPII
jgi:hypothetical protein